MVRKDSIKLIYTIVTASTEFFENRSKEGTKVLKYALGFLQEEGDVDNIFSVVVHMD
jgi:hypothetical protein